MNKFIIKYNYDYSYFHKSLEINIFNENTKKQIFEFYFNPINRKGNFYKSNVSINGNNSDNNLDSNNFQLTRDENKLNKSDLIFFLEKDKTVSFHLTHYVYNNQNQLTATFYKKSHLFSPKEYLIQTSNGQVYSIKRPKSKKLIVGFEIFDNTDPIGSFHFNSTIKEVDFELNLKEEYDESIFLLISILINNIEAYGKNPPINKKGIVSQTNGLHGRRLNNNMLGVGVLGVIGVGGLGGIGGCENGVSNFGGVGGCGCDSGGGEGGGGGFGGGDCGGGFGGGGGGGDCGGGGF